MIKQFILMSSLLTGFISSAEISENLFVFPADKEYQMYEDKFSHVEMGNTLSSFIEEINYIGNKWYLKDIKNNSKYYVQIDPLTKKISRIRIVSEYSDFSTGRDIKYLTEQYGQPKYISDDARFFNDDIRIRLYVDKDVLTPKIEEEKTIIDILNYKENKEKLKSEDIIYKSERMNRK